MKYPMNVLIIVGETVVTAAIEFRHESAVGEAKCHPNDVFDAALGTKLASARAFTALGEKLMIEAENVIYPVQYTDPDARNFAEPF